ncbi:hypothetical protein RHGRI_007818 [Rhododendron griersonianum]|uniref:Uncharacterized protein n=1 Tax=Rhododendron griersonianum TaxID=479676 RepID=A0AAV6L077_9ERIC|nr:hypothetical protein RHGRI_007818 [Rhododendron griersonianum]
MTKGTVSFADGLGLKALDSNELRRRQQISEFSHSPQFRPNLTEVGNKKMNISTDFQSESLLRNAVPTASPSGYGAFCPKTSKASSCCCCLISHDHREVLLSSMWLLLLLAAAVDGNRPIGSKLLLLFCCCFLLIRLSAVELLFVTATGACCCYSCWLLLYCVDQLVKCFAAPVQLQQWLVLFCHGS